MIQDMVVILILGVAAGYAIWQVVKFFAPAKKGKACGGSCCSGAAGDGAEKAASSGATQMVSSDALVARLKARRAS